VGLKGRSQRLGRSFILKDLIMASCPKCGRQKVGKDMQKRRRCRQCGILPGEDGMDRSGKIAPALIKPNQPTFQCEETA